MVLNRMTTKCSARKKNGDRCSADAQSGKTVCVFHDATKSNDVQRARRAGGINRHRPPAVVGGNTPDRRLESPKDVAQLLAESINLVRRGELDPRLANTVGYLSTILLRALEQGPLEDRMAKLEEMLGISSTSQVSVRKAQ